RSWIKVGVLRLKFLNARLSSITLSLGSLRGPKSPQLILPLLGGGDGDASDHALALTVGASQFTVEKNLLHTNVLVDRLLPVALTEPGITQLVQVEVLHVETIKCPLVDIPIESDRHTVVADGNEP